MRIQEHLGKISWSLADKGLYVIYGLISIYQMKYLSPYHLGLFGLLIGIHTWLFVIADAFALQSIVQFGINKKNTQKVNFLALILHLAVCIIIPLLILLVRNPIANIFNEPALVDIAYILPWFCLATLPRTYCIKFIYRDFKMKYLFYVNLMLFLPLTLFTFYFIFAEHNLDFHKMLVMYISSHTISSITAVILTFKELKFSRNGSVTMKELIKFGVPLTMTNSLHALPKQLDLFAIQLFFDTTTAGIYYSAKNLFRVFEESLAAANGLIYPAIIRRLEENNIQSLKDTLTKGVSFLLMVFIFSVAAIELGIGEFFIKTFLTEKYVNAVGQFNLLSIAALFLPFFVFSMLIVAEKKPHILFKYVFLSALIFVISFAVIGYINNPALIPLAYIIYSISLGATGLYYYHKHYKVTVNELFRAFPDMYHFIKEKIGKRKKANLR